MITWVFKNYFYQLFCPFHMITQLSWWHVIVVLKHYPVNVWPFVKAYIICTHVFSTTDSRVCVEGRLGVERRGCSPVQMSVHQFQQEFTFVYSKIAFIFGQIISVHLFCKLERYMDTFFLQHFPLFIMLSVSWYSQNWHYQCRRQVSWPLNFKCTIFFRCKYW